MVRPVLLNFLVLFSAAVAAWAQSSVPVGTGERTQSPYGNAEQPPLRLARESFPRHAFLFGLNIETAYDDDVLSNNANRHSDVTLGISPRLALRQERKRTTLALDYQPGFEFYRRTPGYNATSQGLQFDVGHRVKPRFSLRLRDSAHYRIGIFQPRSEGTFLTGLGSPSSLNETVITPRTREFQSNARLDAIYQKSQRATLALFGGELERDFRQINGGPNLFDARVASAGTEFSYRLSRTTTLGTLYIFQNLSFGTDSRATVHSGFLSAALELKPGLKVVLWGGPQYLRQRDSVTINFPTFTAHIQAFGTSWQGAYGGALTREARRVALQISVQRTVNDGGGVLTVVTNSLVHAGVRRRLARRWDAVLDGDFARTDALGALFPGGRIESQRAGLAIDRFLTDSLTAHLGYNFLHQRSFGQVPFLADVDRNRVNFGLSYRFSELGRRR